MSEEVNEIFEQWKQFLSWCYENNDKTAEIHRDNLEKVMEYTKQLENIIKEVREDLYQVVKWCTENKHNEDTIERYLVVDYGTTVRKINEIRTKLDKEVN